MSQSTNPNPSNLTSEKTLILLGWDLVRKSLAQKAASPVTKELCLSLLPAKTSLEAQQLLEETSEMVSLLESLDGFPIRVFDDLQPVLDDAREKILIEPAQGLVVLNLLRLTGEIKRFLAKKDLSLKKYGNGLDPVSPLAKELNRCIDSDGEIRENASPELKQAIRDSATSKQQLESAVKKILSHPNHKETFQDSYFTEREGRVVLPVKIENRSRIEGIVHDSSGSGSTLFIEPTQIISLNNQLKINLLKIEQEKIKILGQLAQSINENAESLKININILTALDLIYAKARLAGSMQAEKCPLNDEGKLNLQQARNPELVLNGKTVIANDISWDASTKVMIISGPNTGGKTVTLKTVGLMSLMIRAGLYLPVEKNSAMAFYPEVYADIGDDQSIQHNLSTFSAHLEKIIHILDHAPQGTLLLLDELGIATDPMEGAALAEAILMELTRREMVTLVSTHYLSLKILAQTQEGFLNACLEFDMETITPTYKLITGVPGNSAALETAERLGLKKNIIAAAREIYKQKDHRADDLLQILNQQKLELEAERESLAEKKDETEKLLGEQRILTERLRAEDAEFKKTKARKLQSSVKTAQSEIKKIIAEIRGSKDLPKLRKAEKQIHSIGRPPALQSTEDLSRWTVPADQLNIGDEVLVDGFDAKGTLEENPKGKNKVRIKLGNLATVIETKRIHGNSQPGQKKKKDTEKSAFTIQAETASAPKSTCDLRGLRMDEARNAMESFISQAIVNQVSKITIIHGHGMGTIKQMVRDYLASSGIGKSFTPGDRHEGGDGVTVVTL